MVLDRNMKVGTMGFLVGFAVIASMVTIETQSGAWLTATLLLFAAILAIGLYWFEPKSAHKQVLSDDERLAETKQHFRVFVVGMTFSVVLPAIFALILVAAIDAFFIGAVPTGLVCLFLDGLCVLSVYKLAPHFNRLVP